MAKVLVTGGAGFIGSITSKKLIKEGHEVIVYDSLIKGYRESVSGKLIEGCLSDKNLLNKTLENLNIDVVMHFAGFIEAGESMKNPSKFFKNNVVCGINLLEAMVKNNVKKIIYSSSAGIYKASNIPLKETHPKEPSSAYGATKLMFEDILKWYDVAHEIKSISLRYFNATGTFEGLGERHDPETHLIPLTILAALGKRKGIGIFGTDYNTPDGTAIRDYIDVKDLADAHIIALNKINYKSEAYNVGTGKGISVREVINAVKNITKLDFKVFEEERRPGDPSELVSNSDKIKKELGWKPKSTFEQGLKETIGYFKTRS